MTLEQALRIIQAYDAVADRFIARVDASRAKFSREPYRRASDRDHYLELKAARQLSREHHKVVSA